jgi:hypothetical protein
MGLRKAIVAGSFYPADKKELQTQIGDFLEKVAYTKSKNIYGVIAPHAGYSYSGQCAAYAYKAIAEAKKVDTFIILGTNHTGYAESNFAVSTQDFETPLGIIKNDKEFSNLLVSAKGTRFSIGETAGDKLAHQQEHSIEVQLPFLQFTLCDKFKILPIICQQQAYENYVDFSRLLVKTAEKLERKICVIASSDFTHYGMAYGFMPFSTNVKENLYNLDGKAIDLILKFKTAEFLNYSAKTTICGAAAIASAMEICRLLGSKKAKLLKYYTSGDIVNDYGNAVGYASVVFE